MNPKSERTLLLLLAAIQFTTNLDFLIILPLGPQYMRLMDLTPAQFNLIVAAYAIAAGISRNESNWRFESKLCAPSKSPAMYQKRVEPEIRIRAMRTKQVACDGLPLRISGSNGRTASRASEATAGQLFKAHDLACLRFTR
jgi:hypothetical protein